jgi:AAA domain
VRSPSPTSNVRGLAAAQVLSLSRMLGPGYCNTTRGVVRARDSLRSAPARYTREQLDALDAAKRRRYDEQRAVWHANLGPIVTPQLQTLFGELDAIVGSNRQDGDRVRGAAVLSALPGLGKTTAAVCYGVRYHREQLRLYGDRTVQGDLRVPVVYLALTSSTTMRSLNSALCRFFDHPGWAKGNASLLADRATDCVLSCQTRLIIIDDVHFLDMGRRDGREVANHFKWLQTQFPVTFLFVGVGIAERQIGTEGLAPADAALADEPAGAERRWPVSALPTARSASRYRARAPQYGRSGGRSRHSGSAESVISPSSSAVRRPYWSGISPHPQYGIGLEGTIPNVSSGSMRCSPTVHKCVQSSPMSKI